MRRQTGQAEPLEQLADDLLDRSDFGCGDVERYVRIELAKLDPARRLSDQLFDEHVHDARLVRTRIQLHEHVVADRNRDHRRNCEAPPGPEPRPHGVADDRHRIGAGIGLRGQQDAHAVDDLAGPKLGQLDPALRMSPLAPNGRRQQPQSGASCGAPQA